MNKNEFNELFLRVLHETIRQAQITFLQNIPKKFLVELHGVGVTGEIMPQQKAQDLLYIDDKTFYPIIDVGVKGIKGDTAILFVRISALNTVSFDRAWNTPEGNGPFKIIVPLNLERQECEGSNN